MSSLTGAAPKNDASHDDTFVDTDAYLLEMAQRIRWLRSLVPTFVTAPENRTASDKMAAKAPKRKLKSGSPL